MSRGGVGGGELSLVDGNNNSANIQMEACSLFSPPASQPASEYTNHHLRSQVGIPGRCFYAGQGLTQLS